MLGKLLLVIVSLSFILTGCGTINTRDSGIARETIPFQPPTAAKVVLVVMENTSVDEAFKQSFLARLKEDGAFLSNYHGVAHPSQPNYIALISGSVKGVDGDTPPSTPINSKDHPHLGSKGRLPSWTAYVESYPERRWDQNEGDPKPYARRHVPFLSFSDVQENPELYSRIRNFREFRAVAEAGNLPSFSLVIPNLDNDAHGSGPFGGVFDDHSEQLRKMNKWLEDNFSDLIKNEGAFRRDNVLFIVTFDENDTPLSRYSSDKDNRVYTALLGNDVKHCDTDNKNCDVHYDHYDLLYTIETILHADHIQTDENTGARPIGGIWKQRDSLARHVD